MSNEKGVEYYGHKAYDKGFFSEWQKCVAETMAKTEKPNRFDVSQRCYWNLSKEKEQNPQQEVVEMSNPIDF